MNGMMTRIMLLAILCFGGPAFAQEQDEDKDKAQTELKRIEQELKKRQDSETTFRKSAENSKAEVRQLQKQLVKAGKSIQSVEARATQLEINIERLEVVESNTISSLSRRRQEMSTLLATLQRLSKRPPALALLKPGEAVDTARSAKLLGSILPQIENKAALLKNELVALLEVKQELSRDRESLRATLVTLSRQQRDIKKLQKAREQAARYALKEASKQAKAASKLIQKATDLKDLIAKIEKAAKMKRAAEMAGKAAISTGFSLAKGMLTMPAKGKISKYFGSPLRVGKSKGIRVKTRSEAQVIAPFDGEVVFSGPFRDYGQILIISHGDGYHSLLAGMDKIFGEVGEWILAGEPIGEMEKIEEKKKAAELYLELRYNNVAFNPLPWISK